MKLSKTLIICSLLMIFILNVNMASALEFDNVKSYDAITREVTITNAFGLGSDIGKARLNTPLNYDVAPGYQKVAEFDLWAYEDYNDILKSIDFYDRHQKDWEKNKLSKDFDLKYRTFKDVLVDDYKTICSVDQKSLNNSEICEQVKVGSHYEKKEVWTKLTPADLKKNEFVTVGIFTEVKSGDYVEWIPSIYGVKVDEWASWTSDLNTSLIEYWKFEDSSGNPDGSLGSYDLTDSSSALTFLQKGIYNYGVNRSNGDAKAVILPESAMDRGTGLFAMNIWVKLASYPPTEVYNIWASGGPTDHYAFVNVYTTGQMSHRIRDGGYNVFCETAVGVYPADTDWHMITWTRDSSTSHKLYVDGINVGNCSIDSNTQMDVNSYGWGVGSSTSEWGVNNEWAGTIDEFMIWHRGLTTDEITYLYSDGEGAFLNWVSPDASPVITLNSPSSANYTSDQNVTINLTASDDIQISDVKLYVNDVLNQTNASGINNTDYLFDLSLREGDYTIYGKATDNESQETNSDTITIIIDSQDPTINITYPLNGSEIVTFTNPTNVSFNASISDAHLSTCWYYNGTASVTVTCGQNATLSLGSGDHNLAWYANDTLGNEASSEVSFSINYIQANASYPNPAIEGETYPVNLTINATELNSLNGTLYYNGTAYSTTSTINGSIGILNTNLFIDAVNVSTTKSFYWNYTLNGANYSSSTYNHTIYFITPINVSASCSAGLASAMCFDFKDELNLTALSGNINYNFKFGISDTSYKETYGSLTAVSNFCLCVNATVYNNYTLGEGEIQYSKTGYADRRFYTFSTQRLTNETINNTLYLLPSASATSFLFDFKDTNLAPYTSKYTTLLRWYPNLNEYKIVEMAKTDDKGETIMRVQVEDTDYRVGLYDTSGSLITLLNPVRFACLSAPCSYSSLVDQAEKDYTSFFGVEGDIEFNETTNIWTLTWNDPSQNTKSMNLLVTRERGDSSYAICNVSASGFTGILTCDSTGYTGTLVAVAYRTASPATPIFQKIVNTLSSPFASSVGLFFSFILVALLMLIGVYSPVASVILGILALLPALYMGVITLAVFIGIAVLGGIIIHFMKRTG